jgi:tetratricopeptide (TPR) repeat protein
MAGKITTILAKKEAETYRTQGLHKEALHIYRDLLATSPNIDSAFKAGIENQMEKINAELESNAPKEANQLTADGIRRVKEGWGEAATESDMMICAQAFYQIDCYAEALLELEEMLKKGCAADKTAPLIASCLVKLHRPAQVTEAIEKLNRETFDRPETGLHHTILLAETMVSQKAPQYAAAIMEDLQKHPAMDGTASQRLAAIAEGIARPDPEQKDAGDNRKAIVPEQPSPAANDIPCPSPDKPSHPKDKARFLSRWLPFFGKRS